MIGEKSTFANARNLKIIKTSSAHREQALQAYLSRTRDVPEFAEAVVLQAADAVAFFALVARLQEAKHERADDHVAGHQAEQAEVAEQVREELAHAPPESRFRRRRHRHGHRNVRRGRRRQRGQRLRRRRHRDAGPPGARNGGTRCVQWSSPPREEAIGRRRPRGANSCVANGVDAHVCTRRGQRATTRYARTVAARRTVTTRLSCVDGRTEHGSTVAVASARVASTVALVAPSHRVSDETGG